MFTDEKIEIQGTSNSYLVTKLMNGRNKIEVQVYLALKSLLLPACTGVFIFMDILVFSLSLI